VGRKADDEERKGGTYMVALRKAMASVAVKTVDFMLSGGRILLFRGWMLVGLSAGWSRRGVVLGLRVEA